jgi:hypothetical protein
MKTSGTARSALYGYVTNAIVLLCLRLSRRAGKLSWKRWCSAIARMRSFVSAPMSGLSLRARDTVDFDTPARRAMSAIVWTGSSLTFVQPVA